MCRGETDHLLYLSNNCKIKKSITVVSAVNKMQETPVNLAKSYRITASENSSSLDFGWALLQKLATNLLTTRNRCQ